MTSQRLDLPALPPGATHDERLAWAGERQWDVAEGLLTGSAATLALVVVQGWADLCTDAERAQYRTLARNMAELIAALA